MPTSTTTTLQLCSYNSTTDAYTLILDLNNRANYYLNTVKWDQQAKVFVRSSNIRTSGERITAVNDPNRHVQVNMWIRNNSGISTNGLLSLLHALENAIEKSPYYLRIAEPGTGTQYSYIQVLAVTHNIPNEPLVIQSQVIKDISIDFECDPYFRGDRLMLSNLVQNPGFEAPSGPAVTVFNDTFANFNAYTASGGALTQDKFTYLDTVLADSPIRYYRLDETSGTTVYDATGNGNNGTLHGGYAQNATGALTGDADTAIVLNGTTGYANLPLTSLPSGNSVWTSEAWFNINALPGSGVAMIAAWGSNATKSDAQLYVNSSGFAACDTNSGPAVVSGAISLHVWHHMAGTWDGTNIRLYIDGALIGTSGATGPLTLGSTYAGIGAWTAGYVNEFNGAIDEFAIYGTALSAARILAHYNAGHNTPAVTSNTMSIPSGASATFNNSVGSPWSAINNWQIRFRYTAGLTANFYAHFITGSGNYLGVRITGTSMILVKNTASTMTTLATASMTLVPGMQYWLKITQFPGYLLSASLYTDNAGSANYALVSSLSATSTDTTQGAINITASGAALGIGGNYSQVNTVQLFGPGGWYFKNSGAGTGLAAGSWLTDTTQTYPYGPTQSLGALVITSAPAGTLDAWWANADDTSPTTIKATAIPFNAPSGAIMGVYAFGHQLSGSVAANGVILLELWEYTSTGAFNKSTVVQQVSGIFSTYVRFQGTVTLDGSTAYVVIHLRATDANVETADYAFDNVQLWDTVTTKQTTMPYCELRFPQAPAQLLVSGVVGDVLSPAIVAVGVYETAAANPIIVRLGRRAQSGYLAKLLGTANAAFGLGIFSTSAKINSSFYGGMYYINTNIPASFLDYFYVNLAANQGTYHHYANIGITNVPTPTAAAFFLTEFDSFASYTTTAVTPFTANGQQYTVDLGQVSVPLLGYNSLTTLSVLGASFTVTSTNTVGTAGGGSGIFSTSVLMPVDGEIITAKLTTQLSITNTWFYIYSDGITNTLTENRQNSSIPNPYLALVAGSTTGYDAATSIMDTRMNLDPNLSTTNNAGTYTTTGVNQFALVVIDANNAAVPVAVDFYYYPLYRFPR